jgi:hypothetical protein
MTDQTTAQDASNWTFLAELEDENVADGGFQESLLIKAWEATQLFLVHGDTVEATASLFRMVLEELATCKQTEKVITATTKVVEEAKKMCTHDANTQEKQDSWQNLKRLLAKALIAAKVATSWGSKEAEEQEDSKPTRSLEKNVKFERLEGLTGINPVAMFQKYFKYGEQDLDEEEEEEGEEEEEESDGKAKGKKPKKEPLPMELACLIPKRTADSTSAVPLEGIGMIRAITDKQMKVAFKKFKLQKGLPLFSGKPDVLIVLQDAGFDKIAIAEARKQLQAMVKKFTRMKQEVNASLKVAKDNLQCVVALGKTQDTSVTIEDRKEIEQRAMLLAGIQGQRLASFATQCADDFARSIGISTSGLKLRELITESEPMSDQDKREFLDEMVKLGKVAKAAEGCGKRKREYGGGGGYGGGGYGGGGYGGRYQGGKGGGKGNKGKVDNGGGKGAYTNTHDKDKPKRW